MVYYEKRMSVKTVIDYNTNTDLLHKILHLIEYKLWLQTIYLVNIEIINWKGFNYGK